MICRPSKIYHQPKTVANSYKSYLGCLRSIKIISGLWIFISKLELFSVEFAWAIKAFFYLFYFFFFFFTYNIYMYIFIIIFIYIFIFVFILTMNNFKCGSFFSPSLIQNGYHLVMVLKRKNCKFVFLLPLNLFDVAAKPTPSSFTGPPFTLI